MEQIDFNNIHESNKTVSRLIDSIQAKALRWANIKEKLYKDFEKDLLQYPDFDEVLSEQWLKVAATQFAIGKIFCFTEPLKKFFNKYKVIMIREEKELVRHFLEEPWFYTFFSVEECLGGHLLRIFDYATQTSRLLISKAVEEKYQHGASTFLCLLFGDGNYFYTYGVVQFFKGFTEKDWRDFAFFASSHYQKTKNLSEAIARDTFPFMLLHQYSQLPLEAVNGQPGELCHHCLNVSSFNPTDYLDFLESMEKEEVIMCYPKNLQDKGNRLYYEKATGDLHICASGLNQYQAFGKHFKDKFDFPEKPSWQYSKNLEIIIAAILDIHSPSKTLERLFADQFTR